MDYKPLIAFEPPSHIISEAGEEYSASDTPAWIKLSTQFRNHLHRLKGAKLSVFLAICLHVNESRESWPSLEKLQTETGYSRDEIMDTIKELEELKLFRVVRESGRVNRYIPMFAAYGKGIPVVETTTGNIKPVDKTTTTTSRSLLYYKKNHTKKNKDKEEPIRAQKPRASRLDTKPLLATFCELTGIPEPVPSTDKQRKAVAALWWQPAREIIKLTNGSSIEVLTAAVHRMRRDGLTISSPKSVVNMATAIYGERQHDRTPTL